MAFSLRRWLGTLKELKWRQDYNENMKDIEDKINELEANNSLLAGQRFQVDFSNGYGSIPASALGVTDVASYRWLVQAEHKDGIWFACPRLYSSVLVLYLRNQLGDNPPDGTYPINVMRLD